MKNEIGKETIQEAFKDQQKDDWANLIVWYYCYKHKRAFGFSSFIPSEKIESLIQNKKVSNFIFDPCCNQSLGGFAWAIRDESLIYSS